MLSPPAHLAAGGANDWMTWPLSTPHTKSTLSWPPPITTLPSAVAAVQYRKSLLPASTFSPAPLSVLTRCTALSPQLTTTLGLSATNEIEVTSLGNGWLVSRCSPVMKSQTLTTLSAPQLASTLPSVRQATPST